METTHYPTIVIGSGSGGFTVAIGLAQLGRQVALIESHAVGGDCTNVGCIPSKSLIHEGQERSGDDPDSAAAFAKVRHKRDDLRDEETHQVKHTKNLTFMHGYARFVDSHRIAVTQDDGTIQELTADAMVIATGSRAAKVQIDGLPEHRVLTNQNLFELPEAPKHIAIVGSGPISLEMAFALRALGSRVSIATRDERVFNKTSGAASRTLHDSLCEHGIDVYYGANARRYDDATETLTLDTPQGDTTLDGVSTVLLAIGRTLNVDAIGLEHTDVAYDPKKGIEVDSHGQTSVGHIYAIGDVTPTSHWTHSANAQGRRVVQRIAFPWLPSFSAEPLYPNATFSDPEVAQVGLTPEQVAKQYHPKVVKTLRFDLSKTDKGYTEGLKHGFIEVSAMRLTGRILGATIVGPRASEMISFFTLAMTKNISLYTMFRLVYPYPTLSGAIQKVADQFVRETLPVVHVELYNVVRYGAETVWKRFVGGTFEPADTTHERSDMSHA